MPEILMTAENLQSLREELVRLEGPERDGMAERIKTAREWGDLKENAEYHAAKEEQAHLETRILTLRNQLRSVKVVEVNEAASVVEFGSTVTVLDAQSAKEATYTLVASREHNVARGLLSIDSPVARSLIGKAEGDTFEVTTPKGPRAMKVLRLGV